MVSKDRLAVPDAHERRPGPAQYAVEIRLGLHIDRAGRLIQEHELRLRDEDARKSDALLLAKPFRPDAQTRAIFDKAAKEAHQVIALDYERGFDEAFYEGARWAVPVPPETVDGMGNLFADPNQYGLDGRAIMYHMAYFSPKVLGAGQFYLLNVSDRLGKPLDAPCRWRF